MNTSHNNTQIINHDFTDDYSIMTEDDKYNVEIGNKDFCRNDGTEGEEMLIESKT